MSESDNESMEALGKAMIDLVPDDMPVGTMLDAMAIVLITGAQHHGITLSNVIKNIEYYWKCEEDDRKLQ